MFTVLIQLRWGKLGNKVFYSKIFYHECNCSKCEIISSIKSSTDISDTELGFIAFIINKNIFKNLKIYLIKIIKKLSKRCIIILMMSSLPINLNSDIVDSELEGLLQSHESLCKKIENKNVARRRRDD